MMYIFPSKIKKIAIVFMIVGFLGLAYGFLSAPKTVEQSKALQQKNDQLEQAQEIMRNQSFWLQRMMEKLKELKSWPLEDPNIDPDTAI